MKVPLLLLLYNRPNITEILLNRLSEIKPKNIWISVDGPKNDSDKELVKQTLKTVERIINWECDLKLNSNKINLGCRSSVIQAMDWFFNDNEYGIILEDDCIPENSFFDFCEFMLMKYRENNSIYTITGTNYLSNLGIWNLPFYSKFNIIWGWATWKRAWKNFVKGKMNLELLNQSSFFSSLNESTQKTYLNTFHRVNENKLNSWAYSWQYTCFINNKYCITPHKNLISNIGLIGAHGDGKKTENHFLKTGKFNPEKLALKKIKENKLYDKVLEFRNFKLPEIKSYLYQKIKS